MITLTAAISKGSIHDTKIFSITIKETPPTDIEAVAADKAALEIGYIIGDSASSVTGNLCLSTAGSCGTTITWSSSNAGVVSNSGVVTRPAFRVGDATVLLTAKISKGSEYNCKTFNVTIKQIKWTKLIGAGSYTWGGWISVDSSGNSYVTGSTTGNLDGQTITGTTDVCIVKYDSSGTRQWTRLLGAIGADTFGQGISVDDNGNSYVTGYTSGNLDGQPKSGYYDVFVIKYDSGGTKQWTRIIGAANASTYGKGISVDSNGNCYLTGYTEGNLDGQTLTGASDVFIIKYDPSGTKQWVKLLGYPYSSTAGHGISLDSSANCYVTGSTTGNLDGQTKSGYNDTFVIKFDSSGTKQWTKLLGDVNANTVGYGISVDSSGNFYVTGYSGGTLYGQTSTSYCDVFVIKCNASGIIQWVKLLGVEYHETYGFGISVDSIGNSYVTGCTNGDLDGKTLIGYYDAFVIKYDSLGTKQWTKLLGSIFGYTRGYGIFIDSNDYIYVTGYTDSNLDGQTKTGAQDIFLTTKFNP